MANLINAFGDIALDESVIDNRELLKAILTQLRINNAIMAEAYHVDIDMIDTNSDREY